MGTVSLTLPSDGDTIDASDVNNPLNAIAAVINGGIDSTNVTAGSLTPANLTSGTGSSWTWQSWTVTWTDLTVGNSTVVSKYTQIGKTVVCYVAVTIGTTGSSNAAVITGTLPVTAASTLLVTTPIGWARHADQSAGPANFPGYVRLSSTTKFDLIRPVVSGPNIVESVFVAGASTDTITMLFTYEAA